MTKTKPSVSSRSAGTRPRSGGDMDLDDVQTRLADAIDFVTALHVMAMALPHIPLGHEEMSAFNTVAYHASTELHAIEDALARRPQ